MSLLQDQFHFLDQLLSKYRSLWQLESFNCEDFPWREQYPELANILETMTFDQIEQFDVSVAGDWLPDLSDWHDWVWSATAAVDLEPLPSWLIAGIKGRKMAQIRYFCQMLPTTGQDSHWLEWCAGKGHLGRLMCFLQRGRVTSLEWQATLCHEGQQLANKLALPQQFQVTDVLSEKLDVAFSEADGVVALHACGDLHGTLLRQLAEDPIANLCLSPCCYHLTKHSCYRPFSKSASLSKLSLSRADLKLAVKEVATAGARERRLREQELCYRLGFDSWQREARNEDDYLPVPSIPKRLLNEGFDGFCRWAAEQKSVHSSLSFSGFEEMGQQRRMWVARLEAVAQLFRRPLEAWLVLDRALFLEERGYQVEVLPFCDASLTPRNLMIRASRSDVGRV